MDFWSKQTKTEPLFEDILWARPETKQGAGKLLIIGGNTYGFAAAQEAYAAADKAGAGHIRLILPDTLKRTVGVLGPYDYAPSTASGSFGRDSLNEFLSGSAWADAVLLAGDLGRNSETAILLEKYAKSYVDRLIITKDAVDYFNTSPELIFDRPDTCIVLSLAQLQKFGTELKFDTPFLLGMGMLLLVQALHRFSLIYPAIIVTRELDNIVVAHNGRISSTKVDSSNDIWRVKTAAEAGVFWLQNPNRPFEAITSSLVNY